MSRPHYHRDSPLSYHWTASQGQFLVGSGTEAHLESSTDTREAVWVAPADGTSNIVTLTCTIDDAPGDRVNAPLEGGSRNDDALVRTVTVQVVPSYWSATDKAIGFHSKRDENNNIIEPHEWLPDMQRVVIKRCEHTLKRPVRSTGLPTSNGDTFGRSSSHPVA